MSLDLVLSIVAIFVGLIALGYAADARKKLIALLAMVDASLDQMTRLAAANEEKGSRQIDDTSSAVIESGPVSTGEPDVTEPASDLADASSISGVEAAVAEASGAEVEWCVRRPGPGRPSWTAATSDGRIWRITIRAGHWFVREAETWQGLKRVSLNTLAPDGHRTLNREAEHKIDPQTPVYQEARPGAPAWFVVDLQGQTIWRVTHTRWGWAAITAAI